MMKFILLPLLFFLFYITSLYAIGPLTESAELNEDLPLEEHLVLNKIDNDTDLIISSHSVSDDNNIFSVTYKIYPSVQGFSNISNLEVSYSKKLNYCWLDFMISRAMTKFSTITTNNPYLGQTSDKLEKSKDELLTAGIGIGYRSTYVQKALENIMFSEDIFETTSAKLTYHNLNEKFYDKSFTGPGIQTDFGIHKRILNGFHFGMKFAYNLASVKKSKEGNSTSSSGSLVLSWVSFGIDFGFYL